MDIQDTVAAFLSAHHIYDASVLIAVSGGRDSMTLLRIMRRLHDRFRLALHAGYVNHRIRADSDEEDAFVTRQLSSMPDVTLHRYAVPPDYWIGLGNIEENARRIRYDFFRSVCNAHNIGYIATAHHLDDRIETFFINLLRGGGAQTLASIPAVSGSTIRPLLGVPRSDIDDYVRRHNIPYIDDSTNDTDDYLRNRIRHHLVPVLSELSDHYRQSFACAFDYLTENAETVEQIAQQALSCITYADESCAVIDRQRFAVYPDAIRKHIIRHIIGRLHYPCDISRPLLDTLCSAASHIHYRAGSLLAVSKRRCLYIAGTAICRPMPCITVNDMRLSDVNPLTVMTLPEYVTPHIRHMRSDDISLVKGLLSDMMIPAQLYDYAYIIAAEDDTPAAVAAFGSFRVRREFFADGDKCRTVRFAGGHPDR